MAKPRGRRRRKPLDELEERLDRAEPTDVPQPEPGITAPLDEASEEEERRQPVGVMPGAGPNGPDQPRPSDREAPDAEPEESPREERPNATQTGRSPEEPEPDTGSQSSQGPGDAEPDAEPTKEGRVAGDEDARSR